MGIVGGLHALGWGTMLLLAFGGEPFSFRVFAVFVYNAGLMTLFTTGWMALALLAAGNRDTASDAIKRRAVLLLSIALLPYLAERTMGTLRSGGSI